MKPVVNLLFLIALSTVLLLASQPAFGGAGPVQAGKWSTAEINGVKWLISPDGKPFYSKGVNLVKAWKETEKSRSGHAYCWSNFYPTIGEWAKTVGARLRRWGFNTLGGWSDSLPELGLALTVDLELGRNSKYHWHDPFDPAMEKTTIEWARELTAPYRGLPCLIGYYTDNESGWWNSALFRWYLKVGWDNHTKRHLWRMIHDRYAGNWEKLLADWVPQDGIANFEDLKKAGASLKLKPGGGGIRLVDDFMYDCAKRYYGLMFKAIRTAHPGALVLGDRLPLYYHQDAIRAIGDNVDVISTNYNVESADGWIAPYFFDGLRKLSSKPVLVTEFFFAANENRSGNKNETNGDEPSKPGHLMTVGTQVQRSWGAGNAMLNFARFPNVVGAHWFQYCDEPFGGREDGEDYNMGLIDTSNRPYKNLTENFRKINRALETVHRESAARAGHPLSQAGPVRIHRAEFPINVSDQSFMDWEKERTLLRGFNARAPYVPFGDVHIAWRPEGFYLFSASTTYVDPEFLDYRETFPLSEAFQLHFTVERENRLDHFAAYMVPADNPSYADGFEINPRLFRIEAGKPPERLPDEGHVQRLDKALPHMLIEAFLPAKWFGLDRLKPGMRLKANIALVSYYREFTMTLAGSPDMGEIGNPSKFKEIVLEKH